MSVSHILPVNPCLQWQLNPPGILVHKALFEQGNEAHSSKSSSQLGPW